jgi:uncharacterized membrane-anchored protein YitT (DUF2179 family)
LSFDKALKEGKMMNIRQFRYSIPWNLFLITLGSVLFSIGAKGIVVHQTFITGGVFGAGLLAYYATNWLSPGVWFLLFNIPLFMVGWILVSRRFFFYSLCAMLLTTVSYELIDLNCGIHNQFYAAVAGGVICGAGGGVILRSLGSGGGLDIIAVVLNQRYNLGVGRVYLICNAVLFSFALARLEMDLLIASLILVFISSVSVEYVLSMFSQRKIVYIISDKIEDISLTILNELKHGATFIQAKGAYTGKDRNILMTITNNVQLKRLEEVVYTLDANALFIVENTFNVIGKRFGSRRTY